MFDCGCESHLVTYSVQRDYRRVCAHKKSLCLISWLKAATENKAFYDEGLKLAYLWFDDLVIQSPRGDLVTHELPKVLSDIGVPSTISDEVLLNIHPIQSYLPDDEFLATNIWNGDSHVTSATENSLTSYFEEEFGTPQDSTSHFGLRREVALTGAGVIDAVNLVGRLSNYGESFMLPTDFEHRVLQEIMRPADPCNSFQIFEQVANYRLPTLKEIPWNRIAELRHHRFLENFRGVLSTVQTELAAGGQKAAHEIFEEIERKELKQLLSLLKPSSVLSATAKGVLSNAPMPLPV